MLQIFDIQRFALHDGPGIRTTIFTKGCPLRCLWCHNPESHSPDSQLGCLFQQCVACGQCAAVCPNGVHTIVDGVHHVEFDRCTGCGRCIEVCPAGALRWYGERRSTEQLMEMILRDASYYAASGGGLTVSGGEPMMQWEGVRELFAAAQAQNIHTCLDTSGYAAAGTWEALLPVTDLFLLDYKMTEPQAHLAATGVPLAPILRTLEQLCQAGAAIHLRCPIIPGQNDNDDHLAAIAQLSRQYPEQIQQVHVMAYHNMAAGKAAQIGCTYTLSSQPSMTAAEKAAVCRRLLELGCLHLADAEQ